jgi:hypothetical protein
MVRMRCPECETRFLALLSPDALRELEREQSAGRASLVAAHERLALEDPETFAAALGREGLG